MALKSSLESVILLVAFIVLTVLPCTSISTSGTTVCQRAGGVAAKRLTVFRLAAVFILSSVDAAVTTAGAVLCSSLPPCMQSSHSVIYLLLLLFFCI